MHDPAERSIQYYRVTNGPLRCLSPKSDCYTGPRPTEDKADKPEEQAPSIGAALSAGGVTRR